MENRRASGGFIGTSLGAVMTALQATHPQWFGDHPWILPVSLLILLGSLLFWFTQYRWFQKLLGFEQARPSEISHSSELQRVNDARRQCEEERRAALQQVEESRSQLAIFSPLQIEAFRLAKELRQFAEGPDYPKKEDYGYRGDKVPDDVNGVALYFNAKRAVDKQLIFGYERKFGAAVKDFLLRIGESGYPLVSTDWAVGVRDKEGFLKLAADFDMVGVWFGRNKINVVATGKNQ